MPIPAVDASHHYHTRLSELRDALAANERRHIAFSRVRLLIAAAAVAIILFWGLRALAWELVPLLLFVIAAFLHARVLNARDRITSAIAFQERGLARMAHQWIGHGRTGETYRPVDHPYAIDLDIFGRGSLFELLSTARTQIGEARLAEWLLTPSDPVTIRARQEAIRELTPRFDVREEIAVLGDGLRVGIKASLLREWASSPIRLRGLAPRFWLAGLSTATITSIVAWASTGFSPVVVAGCLVFQGLVARWLQPRVLSTIESVGAAAHDLDLIVGMLRVIERERFTSPYLQAVQVAIRTNGRPASAEIGTLEQFVAMLDSRTNIFTAVPAALLLWATQWAYAIESWRSRAGLHVPQWLDAIGDLEALLALASFAAEHPDYAFPEIVDGPAMVRASSVAHPVLPPGAIANDVHLDTRGTALMVVSGSNMSGKSTLLRTIGVNVVLAESGAPVRASSFVCTPLAVGASIHLEDSLTDGRSRFLAEITRLKQVVDLSHAREGALLFLFDEILSGTNSHDRRAGAEALVSGLVATGAVGLVTTHDLALGDIVDRLGTRAENVHFVDHFENGVLRFDYQLRPGIVRTSNALALMKAVGLEI